jgi:hypothetical protein
MPAKAPQQQATTSRNFNWCYHPWRSISASGGGSHVLRVLRSIVHPDQTYIGSTGDLKKRLAEHNSGKSIHTNKFKPRKLEAYGIVG